jgi:ribosomal protein S18 acetylase RimI-like enzyme
MSLVIREMRSDDAEHVVAMVRGLARHVGRDAVPRLTPEQLNRGRDLVDVVVAGESGRLIGACLSLMTFSTWRGARGLYVVDLFVEAKARGRNIGLLLLKRAAARGMARGASFIKLEVDHTNEAAVRFYERLGFKRKDEDRLFVLEQDMLDSLVQRREQS